MPRDTTPTSPPPSRGRDQGNDLPTIAITMGDPAGVGPEICLRVLADADVADRCVPALFGDAGVLRRVAARCGLETPTRVVPASAWPHEADLRVPHVVDFQAVDADAVRPGEVSAACGRAAYTYIEAAIDAATAGRVAALATAPIHKRSLHLAGVTHPGHTEILAARTGTKRYCMLFVSDALAVSLVTIHVGYRDVPDLISADRVFEVIELTADAMRRLRGRTPRLAVCGLNPHAGEEGLFGRKEEENAIIPAIEVARKKGIDVTGPMPPDAAFIPAKQGAVDAVVCMYHDQACIPFKMLSFDTGVQVTLGLPITRTSVGHGTAFDIAWQGKANPGSLKQAVLLAATLARA